MRASTAVPPHRITPCLDQRAGNEASDSRSDPIRAQCNADLPQPDAFFDLVVIGAGPAALALVTRILESRPAALYTEDEHRHLHWLNRTTRTSKSGKSRLLHTSKDGPRSTRHVRQRQSPSKSIDEDGCGCGGKMRILVIDRIGEGWMCLWNRLFAAYDIRHLRSPMFFHPDPFDLDGLIAFAQREGRASQDTSDFIWKSALAKSEGHTSSVPGETTVRGRSKNRRRSSADRSIAIRSHPELIEIPGCVGREVSKHKCKAKRIDKQYAQLLKNSGPAVNERDRRDYFTPGTQLFHDFVDDVTKRYGLRGGTNSEAAEASWPTARNWLEADASVSEAGHLGKQGQEEPVTMLKGEVVDMQWSDAVQDDIAGETSGFHLRLADGGTFGARAVVSAVGPGGRPNIPPYLSNTPSSIQAQRAPSANLPFGPGWSHSLAFARPDFAFPPQYLQGRIDEGIPTTMLVIGGGLTSAQLTSLALSRGVSKVILLLRGHFKVRPFDIGLEWMGRYSNLAKMYYWQTDDAAERLKMLKDARNGGSFNPPYARLLRELEKRGKVEVRTFEQVEKAEWRDEEAMWTVETRCDKPIDERTRAKREETKAKEDSGSMTAEDLKKAKEAWAKIVEQNEVLLSESSPSSNECAPPSSTETDQDTTRGTESPVTARSNESCAASSLHRGHEATSSVSRSIMRVDYILAATGPVIDFPSLPFMRRLDATHPIAHHGGLPVLTQDLQYTPDIPLFAVGAYSGLQIGPAAPNLGGMREAADRVASRLQDLLLPEGNVSAPSKLLNETISGGDRQEPRRAIEALPQESWRSGHTHFGFEALQVQN